MSVLLFDLSGSCALVTGSSQGIGFALAQGLAGHGAEVVLNGRDRSKLEEAAARLRQAGHSSVSISDFDVTNPEAVKRGVDAIELDIGQIDILINNACMQFRTPLEDFPVDQCLMVSRLILSRSMRMVWLRPK